MDWVALRVKAGDYVKKYRYVLLVLLAGIFLMALPSTSETTKTVEESRDISDEKNDLQHDLEEILSQIDGAGKVRVLLTQSKGELTLYQTDEDISDTQDSHDIRRETVILSQSGLIKQVNPPVYQGAIVICQGGNNAAVRLAVVEAVSNATGLTTDHITVLKMK